MQGDTVSRFVEAWCERGAEAKESTVRMWEGYLAWCASQNEPSSRLDAFFESLAVLNIKLDRGYVHGARLAEAARAKMDAVDRELEERARRATQETRAACAPTSSPMEHAVRMRANATAFTEGAGSPSPDRAPRVFSYPARVPI